MPEAERNSGVYLTADEAHDVADMIESYIFQMIRDDDEIDSMEWLCDICELYKRLSNYTAKE